MERWWDGEGGKELGYRKEGESGHQRTSDEDINVHIGTVILEQYISGVVTRVTTKPYIFLHLHFS